ncbi:hypothetical protein [Pontibacter sp. G13]|uniref:hypothetical protein n=1 Tax=Pontibacter sp. G13 TaxID=3074898 RepID=UPI00288C4CDE|nr:hypothetical protein [Pontibacter sp. G13]WNJ17792.1 hypothetical protein RJD25_23315 [Pontibacter sp. G13]
MISLRNLLFLGWLAILLAACQPDPQIVIIPDNTAPPDLAVPTVLRENYVNKLFISLLGRKPEPFEFDEGLAILNQHEVSESDREELIGSILALPEYVQQVFETHRVEMLGSVDTNFLRLQVTILTEASQEPGNEPYQALYQAEIDRINGIRLAPQRMQAGTLSRIEFHRNCMDNPAFEEINMGNQNFVLAAFEYFLKRYPTENEAHQAISMMDGYSGILFGESGSTRSDFLEIFLHSDDYLEGQVLDIYADYLFRSPNSVEMAAATTQYRNDEDYEALLISILKTDEYLGL